MFPFSTPVYDEIPDPYPVLFCGKNERLVEFQLFFCLDSCLYYHSKWIVILIDQPDNWQLSLTNSHNWAKWSMKHNAFLKKQNWQSTFGSVKKDMGHSWTLQIDHWNVWGSNQARCQAYQWVSESAGRCHRTLSESSNGLLNNTFSLRGTFVFHFSLQNSG